MSHESVKYQEDINFSSKKSDLEIPDIYYGFYKNIIAISHLIMKHIFFVIL